jgi:hypothetical protein
MKDVEATEEKKTNWLLIIFVDILFGLAIIIGASYFLT